MPAVIVYEDKNMNFFERYVERLYKYLEKGKPEFNDVKFSTGLSYYRDYLLEKMVRIFEWKGLPFDQRALELATLITGFSGFCFDSGYKNYIAVSGGLTGVTPFPDIYTEFVYAAPKCKGGRKAIYPIVDNGTCVLIENNSLRSSVMPLVDRYAVMLSHADVSIKNALINIRYNEVMTSDNDAQTESMKEWHKKVVEGEFSPILDNTLLKGKEPITPMSLSGKGQIVLDVIDARNEILRGFLSEIGVRYNKDKRANMVTEEVEQNDMALLFNVSDMLKHRKLAADRINELFDLSVTVDLSPEFVTLKQTNNYDGD